MNLHPCPLSDALALIESVLKGYPPSMARSDALLACKKVAEHAQGLLERIAEFENNAREQALQALASEGQWIEQTGALQRRIAELEAQRVPLTKAEITACCNESDTYKTGVWMRVHETTLERLVRAIERAHGVEERKN